MKYIAWIVVLCQMTGAASLMEMYGVPAPAPLPTMNRSYTIVKTIGKAPNLGAITEFNINWYLAGKMLLLFSFNYDQSPYYQNFSPVNTFGASGPSFTLSGSGIGGLDGEYYCRLINDDLIWISKTDSFAIAWLASAITPDPAVFPLLVLKGEKSVAVYRGDAYNDSGAFAYDYIDGNITSKITVTGRVDTKTLGTYVLTYTVKDQQENSAEATRSVRVIYPTVNSQSPQILFNQIGYFPARKKIALVSKAESVPFFVRTVANDAIVFNGMLSKPFADSSDKISIADLSTLEKPGIYYVQIDSTVRSDNFIVSDTLYTGLVKGALKSFYFQRCSKEVPLQFGGTWARLAGHPDTNCFYHSSTGKTGRCSSPGGWDDAGDYGKYTVTAGYSAGTLLQLYELFQDSILDNTGIPESGNGTSDILDEAKYELEWMKTMQDDDGGVFHKLTPAAFDPFIMPNACTADRYIFTKSTPATYCFAAAMAIAARLYRDSAWTADCSNRAEKAWAWASANPAIDFSNPPGVSTGEYSKCLIGAAAKWAATELYASTRKDVYKQAIGSIDSISFPATWDNEETLAWYTLANKNLVLDQTLQNSVRTKLIEFADRILQKINTSKYHVPLTSFTWGSNGINCSFGIVLAYAYHLTGQSRYLDGAVETIDYLLGRNPLCRSYITGFGCNPPLHPHYRISEADGIPDPIPGFVVGGPNAGKEDRLNYPGSIGEMCYLDTVASYASNEVAINWNAPLVFMVEFLRRTCSGLTTEIHHHQASTGRTTSPNAIRFSMTRNVLRLQYRGISNTVLTMRIYDVLGRVMGVVVLKKEKGSDCYISSLDSMISRGMYIGSVNAGSKQMLFKFVIK